NLWVDFASAMILAPCAMIWEYLACVAYEKSVTFRLGMSEAIRPLARGKGGHARFHIFFMRRRGAGRNRNRLSQTCTPRPCRAEPAWPPRSGEHRPGRPASCSALTTPAAGGVQTQVALPPRTKPPSPLARTTDEGILPRGAP